MPILDGIRVLELARFVAGTFCTQMLGDHGAEVIKVEEPPDGEGGRTSPPLWGETGAEFYGTNRGKKSLCLNLRHEQGREVYKRLAASSDVILDVYRPGMMNRLGLGYEDCRKINPRIIYCAMTGYGSEGSMAQFGGHDINFLSLCGALGILGSSEGPPVIPPFYLSSMAGAATYSFGAITMALYHREKTGHGQFCEVSMFESALSNLCHVYADWAGRGRLPRRGDELLTGSYACYNVYECSGGGYISLGAVEARFWKGFCDGIGLPGLIQDQWNPERQTEMKNEIAVLVRTRSRQEWLDHFEGQDICLTPVLDLEEVTRLPIASELRIFKTLTPPASGMLPLYTISPVVKVPDSPAGHSLEYPGPGEHSEEILDGLGFSREEIRILREEKVI